MVRRAALVGAWARSGRAPAALLRWHVPLNARLALVLEDPDTGAIVDGGPPLDEQLRAARGQAAPAMRPRVEGPLLRLTSRRQPLDPLLLGDPLRLGVARPALLLAGPRRLLLADADDPAQLSALLAAAEAHRDAADRVLIEPLSASPSADGAFGWTPLRLPPAHPQAGWLARLRVWQDIEDDADSALPGDSRLRMHQRAGAPGGVLTLAAWPDAPCRLPPADLYAIPTDAGPRAVWGDELLDLLQIHTRPDPTTWPPRFVSPGLPGEARARAAGGEPL